MFDYQENAGKIKRKYKEYENFGYLDFFSFKYWCDIFKCQINFELSFNFGREVSHNFFQGYADMAVQIVVCKIIFFIMFDTSAFFIYEIMIGTNLTWH